MVPTGAPSCASVFSISRIRLLSDSRAELLLIDRPKLETSGPDNAATFVSSAVYSASNDAMTVAVDIATVYPVTFLPLFYAVHFTSALGSNVA